jgi:hypothetical protein
LELWLPKDAIFAAVPAVGAWLPRLQRVAIGSFVRASSAASRIG